MGIKITCEQCGWLVDETVYCHKCMFKAEDEVEELKAEVERLWAALEHERDLDVVQEPPCDCAACQAVRDRNLDALEQAYKADTPEGSTD